jgi:cell division septation protein DedD
VPQLGKAPGVKPATPAAQTSPAVPGVPVGAAVPATPTVPTVPETFTLRAGAFADEAEAQALAQQLAGRGLQASVVAVPTSGGALLHTVVAGNYASRQAAAAAAAELARRQGLSLAVVASPPRPAQ